MNLQKLSIVCVCSVRVSSAGPRVPSVCTGNTHLTWFHCHAYDWQITVTPTLRWAQVSHNTFPSDHKINFPLQHNNKDKPAQITEWKTVKKRMNAYYSNEAWWISAVNINKISQLICFLKEWSEHFKVRDTDPIWIRKIRLIFSWLTAGWSN